MPERFLADGKRLIDWKGADRLRRFRRFCREWIKIPDGHNAGLPMTLYPAQVDWVRSIIHADATVITVAKGNAKSSTLAAICLWWAIDPPIGDRNSEIVIVAGSKDQAKAGVYDTAVEMLKTTPLVAGWSYHQYLDVNDPRIEFRNGSTIRIRSSSPKRLHGIKPSLSVLDEIGLVDDPLVWNTLVQSLGKRPVTRVVGIGTPGWNRGTLFDMKVAYDAGLLPKHIAFHEYAAPSHYDVDDRRGWKLANPVRAAMDPDGWERTLSAIRDMPTVTAEDFRTFHLCQWPDLRGAPVVSAARWDTLAGSELNPDDPVHIAMDGDWQRRNLAVVAAVQRDRRTDLTLLGVWENQETAVDPAAVVAAIQSVEGPIQSVTIGRSIMAAELIDELDRNGIPTIELNTSSAATMREPTDRTLAAIEDGTLRHDDNPLFRAQVLGARQDIRRDGVVFMRDDRLEQRIDALVAAAAAIQATTDSLVPQVY